MKRKMRRMMTRKAASLTMRQVLTDWQLIVMTPREQQRLPVRMNPQKRNMSSRVTTNPFMQISYLNGLTVKMQKRLRNSNRKTMAQNPPSQKNNPPINSLFTIIITVLFLLYQGFHSWIQCNLRKFKNCCDFRYFFQEPSVQVILGLIIQMNKYRMTRVVIMLKQDTTAPHLPKLEAGSISPTLHREKNWMLLQKSGMRKAKLTLMNRLQTKVSYRIFWMIESVLRTSLLTPNPITPNVITKMGGASSMAASVSVDKQVPSFKTGLSMSRSLLISWYNIVFILSLNISRQQTCMNSMSDCPNTVKFIMIQAATTASNPIV